MATAIDTNQDADSALTAVGGHADDGVVLESSTSSIEVFTKRDWYGNPRLGEFIVYLDGRKVGRLPRPGRLVVPCDSGDHILRIRQWWYFSPRLTLGIRAGERLAVEADFAHRDSLLRRFLRFMFVPWHALSLNTAGRDS